MTDTATIIDMRGIFKREQRANGFHPMGMPALPPEGPTAARAAAKRALNAKTLIITEREKAELERAETEDLLRRCRVKAAEVITLLNSLGHAAEAVRLFQAMADEARDMLNEGNANA